MIIKVNKVEAWESQDGSLFLDKEEALKYDKKTSIERERNNKFKENYIWIKQYIFDNHKEDLKDYIKTVDDVDCYEEGEWGWECDGQDNPIDRCIYTNAHVMGDDCCIFCGEPEERK